MSPNPKPEERQPIQQTPPPVISIHRKIIKLMLKFGYDINEAGVCFGIALMAAQASLLGEKGLKQFHRRINLIKKLILNENNLKNPDLIQENNPSLNKQELVDLQAFCDGVYLYQKSKNLLDIQNIRFSQIDTVSGIFQLTKPPNLEEEKLNKIDNHCGCYNQDTLKKFLQHLNTQLYEIPKNHSPIIIRIGSEDHAVAIVYFPNSRKYAFIDSNQLHLITEDNMFTPKIADLENFLWKAFNYDNMDIDISMTIALNTTIFATTIKHKLLKDIPTNITKDIYVNDSTLNNSSLIYLAAMNGHIDVIQFLLENGANVDQPSKRGLTALYVAAQNGHIGIVQLLLENRANVDQQSNEGFTPLHLAAQNGHTGVVQLLLENRANVDQQSKSGVTALYVAAKNGHTGVVQLLLENRANVDQQSNEGFTPLHLAAQNGHIGVVQLLLTHGANINLPSKGGFTALYLAAQNGHIGVVQLLLKHGANINLPSKGGFTPLHLAAQNGHIGVVQLLLTHGANVDQQSNEGFTPLHLAAQNGHIGVVQLLLTHGANVDQPSKRGVTALYLAAQNGHIGVVQLLLKHGANINLPSKGGFTPLMIAKRKGHTEIVKLLEHQAHLNTLSHDSLTRLSINNTTYDSSHLRSKLEKIEQKFGQSIPKDLQEQDIFQYISNENIEKIKELLEHGINIDLQNPENGNTLLHLAVLKNNTEILNILIDYGANINQKNKNEYTPLALAIEQGNANIFKILLDKHINVPAFPLSSLRKMEQQVEQLLANTQQKTRSGRGNKRVQYFIIKSIIEASITQSTNKKMNQNPQKTHKK